MSQAVTITTAIFTHEQSCLLADLYYEIEDARATEEAQTDIFMIAERVVQEARRAINKDAVIAGITELGTELQSAKPSPLTGRLKQWFSQVPKEMGGKDPVYHMTLRMPSQAVDPQDFGLSSLFQLIASSGKQLRQTMSEDTEQRMGAAAAESTRRAALKRELDQNRIQLEQQSANRANELKNSLQKSLRLMRSKLERATQGLLEANAAQREQAVEAVKLELRVRALESEAARLKQDIAELENRMRLLEDDDGGFCVIV